VIDVSKILGQLAVERPIFHSEADFQHALAWKLHEVMSEARIRLEYRPFPGKPLYLDIWMGLQFAAAIELKYATRKLLVEVGDEQFNLKGH
jgi:hypothetical protein